MLKKRMRPCLPMRSVTLPRGKSRRGSIGVDERP
jgi:hypothetical protein